MILLGNMPTRLEKHSNKFKSMLEQADQINIQINISFCAQLSPDESILRSCNESIFIKLTQQILKCKMFIGYFKPTDIRRIWKPAYFQHSLHRIWRKINETITRQRNDLFREQN